jgi:hypothetical protein
MNLIKQIVTIIFTVFVFIILSNFLSAKFSVSDFFNGSPKPTINICLLPSYSKAMSACNHFDNQSKYYQDAYLIGDSGLIELAERSADKVRNCIQDIIKLIDEGKLPNPLRNELQELLQDYNIYTKEANSTYANAAAGSFEQQNAMFELAKKQRVIDAKLKELSQFFFKEIYNGIENVNNYSKL